MLCAVLWSKAGQGPAVVTEVFGTHSVNVRVFPKGGTWRRHIEQLRPRYGVHEDADPGEPPASSSSTLETAIWLS